MECPPRSHCACFCEGTKRAVLNGHIHQVMQKVEGNVAFHTAMATAFPQPAPGSAPSPGPVKVPDDKLRSLLGTTEVNFVRGQQRLAARHIVHVEPGLGDDAIGVVELGRLGEMRDVPGVNHKGRLCRERFDLCDGFFERTDHVGRSLLLGLEVLVAADIVKTIAHELSVMSLGLLAGLVLVRTFLSWTLVLEIGGRWPWQREPSLMSSRARSGENSEH